MNTSTPLSLSVLAGRAAGAVELKMLDSAMINKIRCSVGFSLFSCRCSFEFTKLSTLSNGDVCPGANLCQKKMK